jgi:hypothetical protein
VPTTTYMELAALQAPISIGNDSSNRAMMSFNVLARHVGSPGPFEEEVCKLIQTAGLATLWTDMFFGTTVQIPQNLPGPYVSVNATGGVSPLQSHNGDKQTRPSAQIIVRAGTFGGVSGYVLARNKANAIHAALDGRHNVNITT